MKINITLEEVLPRCNNWDQFCEEKGWSGWAVNEGGGDIEISLSEAEAWKYGILKNQEI